MWRFGAAAAISSATYAWSSAHADDGESVLKCEILSFRRETPLIQRVTLSCGEKIRKLAPPDLVRTVSLTGLWMNTPVNFVAVADAAPAHPKTLEVLAPKEEVPKMRPNDTLEFIKVQPYEVPKGASKVLLLGKDLGVAKLYQVARQMNADPSSKAHVLLVGETVRREEIPLLSDMVQMTKHSGFFDMYMFVEEAAWKWPGGYGVISEQSLKPLLPSTADAKVLVSGPEEFTKRVAGPNGVLTKLGIKAADITVVP
eukprot:PhM_4_TR4923/c0_g1_i1/m.34727/K00326/E1.6.2.2; cytochrome-b5 reductase